MQKSAYLIHVFLAFYLLAGTAMVLTPQWVVAGKINLLAWVKPATLPSPESRRAQVRQTRKSGWLQLAMVLLLVVGMNLTYGLRPTGSRGGDNTPLLPGGLQRLVAEHLQSQIHGGRYPALVATGIAGNERFFVGLGSIQPGAEAPPTEDTLFEIGSISKVFTGILLAKAVENGELSLEQEAATLLFPSTAPGAQPQGLRLGALVTHTAGLPRSPPCAGWLRRAWAGFRGGNPYSECSAPNLLQGLPQANCPTESAQGMGEEKYSTCSFEYSNYGFALLGQALATHAGRSFDALVRKEITLPLGMASTGAELDPVQRSRLAPGHTHHIGLGPFYGAQRAAPWTFPDAIVGAGGLRSSAADMERFLEAACGRAPPDLLPAIRRSQAILYREPADGGPGQDEPADPKAVSIGMAWFEKPSADGKHRILFHNGMTSGHAAYLGLVRDQPVGIVLMGNAASDLTQTGEALLNLLIAHRQANAQ